MNKSRLEAFSDGVFAIVITLLILNVKVPETNYNDLGKALIDILPAIGIYVMSFLLVGMYWVFHHYSFTLIGQLDGVLLWMNILFLLFMSFMPFPAMLMGKYPFTTLPVIIYGSNLVLANATGFIMLIYLQRNKNLTSALFTKKIFTKQFKTYLSVNVIYLAAIFTGFLWPAISCIIFAVMAFILIIRSVIQSGVGTCKM